MKRIFKYPIQVTDHTRLTLPRGARILSVMNQREEIVLYALVEDSAYQNEAWEIEVRGTGHDASGLTDHTFLGTVEMHQVLMFHVFVRRVG